MKKLKKASLYIVVCSVMISLLMVNKFSNLYASSISAGASSSTVAAGGTFTVNVNINGGGSGMFYFKADNASISASSIYCEDACSITATAGSSGTATVYVSTGAAGTPDEVTDKDNNTLSFSSPVSVTIITSNAGGNTGGNTGGNSGGGSANTTPTTSGDKEETQDTKEKDKENKDKVSSLGSLSIDTGKLSPAFTSDTTSYEVNLPAGTTKLNVDAKATSEKASVRGIGAIDLKIGENNIEIICTAEDGSTSVYTIKATVSEKPIANVKYGNKTLGVLNQSTNVSKLFTETKIKLDGKEVIAWKNESLKMTLLYMQDEKTGEKNLYIYDEAKKEATSIYKPFAFNGKNLVMVDIPKELQDRKGMKLSTVKLGDVEVIAWVFENKAFSNYALLYVMDEAGNMVYYQYEKKENSLQLFSQAAPITQDDYQAYVKKMEQRNQVYLVMLIVFVLLSISFLISTIVLFRKRKNDTKFKKVKIDTVELSAEAKSLLNKD